MKSERATCCESACVEVNETLRTCPSPSILRGTAEFVTGLEQAALQVASIALMSMGNLQCVQ